MDDSMIPKSRFWGLVLQPGKRYEQTSQNDFHISMATLDLAKAKDKSQSQVSVQVDGQSYIICNLSKASCVQQPLDLLFDAGDTLAFSVAGDCAQPVHLTGYYTMNEDGDMDDMYEADEEEAEDEEEEEAGAPQLVPLKNGAAKGDGKTAKALKGDGAQVNGDQQKTAGTKRKQEQSPEKAAKASKLSALVDNIAEEEESDDEDYECAEEGDVEDEELEEEGADDEEVEEGFGEEEVEDDDDDEEGDEEEMDEGAEDSDDEESEEEEDVAANGKAPKPQQNGKAAKKEVATAKAANKENKQNGAVKGVKKTISGGVMIEDLVVGNGPVAKSGRSVTVYYRGVLKQNNKQFDATTSGPGFKFRLGAGDVIKGWDRGVEGMKVGGKRRITCPPPMAYGKRGSPPVIPPNSTLVFEVTLKNAQ